MGSLCDQEWSSLLGRLPAGVDLAGSARERGAFVRPRGIRSPEVLLRPALVYAATPLSLRATATWAAAAQDRENGIEPARNRVASRSASRAANTAS